MSKPDEVPVIGSSAQTGSVPSAFDRPIRLGFALTLGGLIAIGVGLALSHTSTVLIYIGLALFVALGLDPLVSKLEARKVRRAGGIVIVYSGFAAVMAGALLLVAPTVVKQIVQFVSDVPTMVTEFKKSAIYGWVHETFGVEVSTLVHDATTFLTQPEHVAALGKGVLQAGVGVVSTISGLIIVIVLSLYFLASLPAMKRGLARLSPAYARERVSSLTTQIAESVGSYLMGMVLLAFCNSFVALILHVALGLPFPMLMAVIAFGITLIPLVGSVLYWGIATAVALFTGWLPALVFAAVYLVYMQIEAYVLTPKVMSRAIAVPGALVVIGALVGGTLLGLLGALIAIPVTASILLITKQVMIPHQDARTRPRTP